MIQAEVTKKRHQLAQFFQNRPDDLTKLSDPTTSVQLPFPSCMIDIPRFSLNDTGEFSFCGRQNLDHMCDWMISVPRFTKRVIRGSIGSGKSMMIGAAVLRFMQPNTANDRKVIYIPDCQLASWKGLEMTLLEAIAIAFHDDARYHFDFQQFWNNETAQREYIFQFLYDITAETRLMFVFDGFNYYEPTTVHTADKPVATSERDYLLKLATRFGSCIVALSSQSQSSFLHTSSDYCINGGLSHIEWAGWSMRAPFRNLIGFATDPLIDYTGLIPLILTKFSSYSELTFEERVYRYEDDNDFKNCGGRAVMNELMEFTDSLWQKEKNDRDKYIHVEMMKNALSGRRCEDFNANLMDHRFFYFENGVIHPICGFVRRVIANYIPTKSDMRISYFTNLNQNWLNEALLFAGSNSSMRGFYYEKYAIAQIMLRTAQIHGWDNIFIHDFSGNFPAASQLSMKHGVHIYLPKKFNQRYINMVIRSIHNDTMMKQNKKRAVIATSIQFIKITLQQPTQHTDSFNVFTTLHDEDSNNIPDYQRYIVEGDSHQVFAFHWVTPHTVDSIPPLPIAVRSILGNPQNDHNKFVDDIIEEATNRYTWDIFTV